MDRMELQEGEVIQHRMISRSIEGAQKKVEQSNFPVRKRLLEYECQLNAQREVIYKRRKHALLGKRLHLDTMSMVHDTVADLLAYHGDTPDREAQKLSLLKIFVQTKVLEALNHPVDLDTKIRHTYQAILQQYADRKAGLQNKTWPLLSAMYTKQGDTAHSFSLPCFDG